MSVLRDRAGSNPATPVATTWQSDGNLGNVIYGDGVNGYIDCGVIPAINGAICFSVSMWVRPMGSFLTKPFWGNLSPATYRGVLAYTHDSLAGCIVYAFYNNGVGAYAISDANLFSSGQQLHIVCVFNGNGAGNAARAQIYVNGKARPLTFEGAGIPTSSDTSVSTLRLLNWGSVNNGRLNAYVGDTRLHPVALSPAEVWAQFDPATRWDFYLPIRRYWGMGQMIAHWPIGLHPLSPIGSNVIAGVPHG